MTAPALQAPPRRVRVLERLAQDPERALTCGELVRAVGGGGSGALIKLLESMERHAQVVSATEWRPQASRPVRVWRIAPPGTVPPPPPVLQPDELAERRRRDRENQRARRARLREEPSPSLLPLALPPGAACAGANPALFFPAAGQSGAEAAAICAACPIRGECYALARRNGETCGIWGGIDFAAREEITITEPEITP